VAHQEGDGHWEEYSLPVGASDAWVTAYIGLALHGRAGAAGNEAAGMAAHRAARWLLDNRPYPAGWGYNGKTGPDADSTAHALALVQAAGLPVETKDTEWVAGRWQPDGGFATFEGPGAWGCAHVDITPICFRVLPAADRARLEPDLLEYLHRRRRQDGSWPSYWWRTSFYTTHACLLLLHNLEPDSVGRMNLAGMRDLGNLNSGFDLAFAAGIAALQGAANLKQILVQELLRYQNGDGGWSGGHELRVTHPGCYRPWERPEGRLYCDIRGLMATATSVSVLSRL
jgi:hypothetical protein